MTMAQVLMGTLPGCWKICSMIAVGRVLSIMRLAKRPGSVACPISVAADWAAKSLTLMVLTALGWPVVSRRRPSQLLSQICPAERRG